MGRLEPTEVNVWGAESSENCALFFSCRDQTTRVGGISPVLSSGQSNEEPCVKLSSLDELCHSRAAQKGASAGENFPYVFRGLFGTTT